MYGKISLVFLQYLGSYSFFHMFAQLHVRQYTKCFGKKIASLVDKLKPKCDYVSHHDSVNALELWEKWSWDDRWLDAGMPAFIKYLYGARSLKIPTDWAKVLPKRIWIAQLGFPPKWRHIFKNGLRSLDTILKPHQNFLWVCDAWPQSGILLSTGKLVPTHSPWTCGEGPSKRCGEHVWVPNAWILSATRILLDTLSTKRISTISPRIWQLFALFCTILNWIT